MSFFSCAKKTQVELQGLYEIDRVKKSGAQFEDDLESWTNSSSPVCQTTQNSEPSKTYHPSDNKRDSISEMLLHFKMKE